MAMQCPFLFRFHKPWQSKNLFRKGLYGDGITYRNGVKIEKEE